LHEFISFFQQGLDLAGGEKASLDDQFHPKDALISFFFDDANLVNKLRP
jgi:hypothetical protein